MSPADALYIGIDIGGTKILALAGTVDGQVLGEAVLPTPSRAPAETVVAALAQAAKAACADARVSIKGIRGVGVAAAGAIESARGVVRHCPHVRGLDGAPVLAMLRAHVHAPSVIGNDANLAALGEHRYGAGRGIADLVYVTLSTGIGCGIITGGRLLTGAHGFAGELGHATVDAHGPLGDSTNPGAWESLCGGDALARITRERLAAGARSGLRALLDREGPDAITPPALFTALRAGDAIARSIVDEAILYLAAGLTTVVNAVDPAMLIIGGGLAQEWDAYVAPAVLRMRQQAYAGLGAEVAVVPAVLGARAGAWGAIVLAAQAVPPSGRSATAEA